MQWVLFLFTGIIEIAKKGIDTFDFILKLKSNVYDQIQVLGSRMPPKPSVFSIFYTINLLLMRKKLLRFQNFHFPLTIK